MTFLQRIMQHLWPLLWVNYSPADDLDGLEVVDLIRECRAARVENACLRATLATYGQTPSSLGLRLKVYKQQLKAAVRAS